MTTVEVVRGDITKVEADVIVNAANRDLRPGAGVDGAIRAAGGPSVTEATAALGGVETGHAVATTAGHLPASWIVHTAGPMWGTLPDVETDELLDSSYRTSLDLTKELRARSIAFPGISTGIYRYPLVRAARIATDAVRSWIEAHPTALDKVIFVCFEEESYRLYVDLLGL